MERIISLVVIGTCCIKKKKFEQFKQRELKKLSNFQIFYTEYCENT